MSTQTKVFVLLACCVVIIMLLASGGVLIWKSIEDASVKESAKNSDTNPIEESSKTDAPHNTTADTALPTAEVVYKSYPGYDLSGTDISSSAVANSYACKARCAADNTCSFYVTNAAGTACWLKKDPGGWTHNNDRIVNALSSVVFDYYQSPFKLLNGQWIYQDGKNLNAYLKSENGLFVLSLQGDGNLCLHRTDTNKLCWCSGTGAGKPPYKLIMQPDNNLTIYSQTTDSNKVPDGTPIWASNTAGKGTAGAGVFLLQNDSNGVIYSPGAIWAINPKC